MNIEPTGPHQVEMNWSNLLFVHWRVPADSIRSLVPAELEIDTFDGSAWLGLVPFEMTETAFRRVPPLPGLTRFFECNVRTYVRHAGQTGVWFMSLDAARILPVLGGRWLWSLNYVYARFRVERVGDRTDYRLDRRRGPWPKGSTRIVWSRGDDMPLAQPGSLEYFLTERYWLYTKRHGKIMHGRVVHDPWTLREAQIIDLDDGLIRAAGIDLGTPTRTPDHVMMSDLIKTRGFRLTR